MKMSSHKQQAGFVSILTVLLFMVLTSIVTVSFMRVVSMEQQQTIDDDLSKGAYDAAQAGIEDAKRAIKYCKGSANCDDSSGVYRQQCPGFFNNNAIVNALDINKSDDAIIVGDPSANQRYTCVTVSNETLKVWGELDPASAKNQAVFMPLRSGSGFSAVKISWNLKAPEGAPPTVVPSNADVNPDNPRYTNAGPNSWGSTWPAMMRAMLVRYPKTGSFTPNSMQSVSKFLVPVNEGSFGNTVAYGGLSRDMVYCNAGNTGNAENNEEYVCHTTITGLNSGSYNWFLQLAPQYQPTNFKVELLQSAGGSPVLMQDVGYVIDSTGSSGNVYRRVQVLVGPDDVVSPSAAIQSGKALCKNFWITGYHLTPGVLFSDLCD